LNLFWHLFLDWFDTLDVKNRSRLNSTANTGSQVAVKDASQEKDFTNHELLKFYN